MPRLQIFIPCYNTEKYLSKAIKSVFNQTYQDWELLIIDDASFDNSFSIAQQFADLDNRVTVLRNESRLGMLGNWNKGIDFCEKELFVKLDADDFWHPEFLEKSISVLDKYPEVALVFTEYVNVDDTDLIIKSKSETPENYSSTPFSTIQLVKSGEENFLKYDILRQGLSIIRYEVFNKIGKYRYLLSNETQASTDTEFYFRVGCHYKIYIIPEKLYYYRKHENSISSIDEKNFLQAKKIYETKFVIFKYYLDNKKILSSFHKKEIKTIKFKYYSYLFSYYRKQRKIRKAIRYLLQNFVLFPKKTLLYNLHINRIIK